MGRVFPLLAHRERGSVAENQTKRPHLFTSGNRFKIGETIMGSLDANINKKAGGSLTHSGSCRISAYIRIVSALLLLKGFFEAQLVFNSKSVGSNISPN